MDKLFNIYTTHSGIYCHGTYPVSRKTHQSEILHHNPQSADVVAVMRFEFHWFLSVSIREISLCVEDPSAKNDLISYVNWCQRMYGKTNPSHDFHTICNQYIQMMCIVRKKNIEPQQLQWLESLEDSCTLFSLNWTDPERNPLPTKELRQMAS